MRPTSYGSSAMLPRRKSPCTIVGGGEVGSAARRREASWSISGSSPVFERSHCCPQRRTWRSM
jgi:hypothetical protein